MTPPPDDGEEHDLQVHVAACIVRHDSIQTRLGRIEVVLATAAIGLISGLVYAIKLLLELLARQQFPST